MAQVRDATTHDNREEKHLQGTAVEQADDRQAPQPWGLPKKRAVCPKTMVDCERAGFVIAEWCADGRFNAGWADCCHCLSAR